MPRSHTLYPPLTIVVVCTPTEDGVECRIGRVRGEDFPSLRNDDGSLNPTLAKHCFGSSIIYSDETKAERVAMALYEEEFERVRQKYLKEKKTKWIQSEHLQANAVAEATRAVTGVKVLHFLHSWPEIKSPV